MKPRCILAALLLATPLLTACSQRNLFAESDSSDKKLKYWDNDSAVKTHKTRDQANGWGFGYPTGMGFQ